MQLPVYHVAMRLCPYMVHARCSALLGKPQPHCQPEIASPSRTGPSALFGETMRGILGAESLCCARIAAFSPELAATRHGERRVRRMVQRETTTRSTLDPDAIVARLQARTIEQLRDEPAIWFLVDGSDLRKPHARAMEHLQRVKRLGGEGTVPGYRTLNALGVGRQRRGLHYHRLFSTTAPGFKSESDETLGWVSLTRRSFQGAARWRIAGVDQRGMGRRTPSCRR